MQATVEFTIPGRPLAWARAGGNLGADGRGARHFTPHKQRAHMKTMQSYFRAAGGRILTGPLRLEVLAVYAIPVSWSKAQQRAARHGLVWKTSVPDWDNLGKIVSDALNAIAYADDAFIVRATVGKRYGHPERTVVRLTPVEPWQEALAKIEAPEPAKQGALL